MGIFDFDRVLASDSAMECVEKLLGVIYEEDDEFKEIGKMPYVVGCCSVKDSVVSIRHPFEYYDELFKWWTRLRAVEVEAKLSELVAAANDLSDLCEEGCFSVWYADGNIHESIKVVQGSSYLVLALMSLAAGARVPARLKDAFVAAFESELARVKDFGAPPTSLAVILRESLLEGIRGYDFENPPHRVFVRECFGPRELSTLAMLRSEGFEDADAVPWFPCHPSVVNFVPLVAGPDIPRSSVSPWRDTWTLHCLTDGDAPLPHVGAPLPKPTYMPPAFPDSLTPPRLDVAVLTMVGKSPSVQMVRSMIHVKHRTCANCGKVAAKGSTFRKCARCTVRTYCDVECQKSGWAVHRNECKKFVDMIRAAKEDSSDAHAEIPKAFAASFFSLLSRGGICLQPPQDTPRG